jgi:DNA polymerase-4
MPAGRGDQAGHGEIRPGRAAGALDDGRAARRRPLSIDEAFLELEGTERLHHDPPARVLARFARRVEEEIGITVSVGLSYCKFLAKVASDLQKPRGFSVIGEAEALSFLAPRPVTTIWGVGKAFAATLERDGIRTVGQLQTMEESDLMRR